MKNFFWFLYKPQDEREQALYQKANSRLLTVLLSGLIIGAFILSQATAESQTIPTGIVITSIFILIVISLLAGWYVLRKEELSKHVEPVARRVTPQWLLILPTVWIVAMIFTVLLFPAHALVIAIIFTSIFGLLLYGFAWVASRPLPLITRLLLVAFFPLFTYFLTTDSSFQKGRLDKSVAKAIGWSVVFTILLIVNILLVRRIVFVPVYVATDYFEPALHRNQLIYANKLTRNFKPDDYIIYKGEKRYVIAKVISATEDKLEVENADGKNEIEKNSVIGKLK